MIVDLDAMERATRETVERALAAYVKCALWCSYDESGIPLDADKGPDDLSADTRATMLEDVHAFLSACWGDTWTDFRIDLSGWEPEEIGHDLWLTRNGHGAGFWDRGKPNGDALADFARTLGESDLYVADDGTVCIA